MSLNNYAYNFGRPTMEMNKNVVQKTQSISNVGEILLEIFLTVLYWNAGIIVFLSFYNNNSVLILKQISSLSSPD